MRCNLSVFGLCDGEFEITAVDDITVGITCAAFCCHIAHIAFASSWYLFCLSVFVLARLCVFGTAMSIKRVTFVLLFIKVMSGRLKYVVLSVSMLRFQYTGWCVLILWTLIVNQFGRFCQFLLDNFGQSIVSLYTLGRCQLLTCCSNVLLDCLRFFSTSSAQLIGVCRFTIHFLQFPVSATRSCIAAKKPPVSHLFDASMLHIVG